MDEKQRVNQLELLLSELIHTNELSEKRLAVTEERLSMTEERLSVLERLQLFFIPVLVLIGGGTLFAIFKLLEIL